MRVTTTTTSYYCTGLVGVGGGAWRPSTISWVDPHPNQAKPGRKSRRRGGRGKGVEKELLLSEEEELTSGVPWWWAVVLVLQESI